jgi:preprotein translocase subunit SecA
MAAHHFDSLTGEDDAALALFGGAAAGGVTLAAANPKDPSSWGKTGRNDPCPCGSGRKYKRCHGDPRNQGT